MPAPKVSVVMPVYNGELFIKESVESILRQSFKDFELLVINDGSTDGSPRLIESFKDSRIRLINHRTNLGQAQSLNRGFAQSRGEYIAHLDCDDISLPERLESQVAFLDAHANVGICGTWVRTFGRFPPVIRRYPATSKAIICYLPFANPLAHSSVMMRKESLCQYDLAYNPKCRYSEDFELWIRCVEHFEVCNIANVLVWIRVHSQQASRVYRNETKSSGDCIRSQVLSRTGLLSESETDEACRWIYRWPKSANRSAVLKVSHWLHRLADANRRHRVFPEPHFKGILGWVWFRECYHARSLGAWAWQTFRQSPLSQVQKSDWILNFRWIDETAFRLRCHIRK